VIWTIYDTSNGLISQDILSIASDTDGIIWAGSDGWGIAVFENNKWMHHVEKYDGWHYFISDSMNYNQGSGSFNNWIEEIVIDNENIKWFCTHEGVLKYDGVSWIRYDSSDGLKPNSITSLAIDSNDNKWIGTAKRGIVKFNGVSKWDYYDTSDGLANNSILSLAIDINGNKWFGTRNGISKFDDTLWTNYYKNMTINRNNDTQITDIVLDSSGNLWLTAEYNYSYFLIKYDNNNWTNYPLAKYKAYAVDSINNVWVVETGMGKRGISKFNGDSYNGEDLVFDSIPCGQGGFTDIEIDSKGNIWVSGRCGVIKYGMTDNIERKLNLSKRSQISILPNPFNPSASISYNLGSNRTGTMQIFNIQGKMVFERPIQGSGTVIWDASGLGSGVYVLKAFSARKTYSRKLILQR
jgi:ligand-binding sensor domain-containing protein